MQGKASVTPILGSLPGDGNCVFLAFVNYLGNLSFFFLPQVKRDLILAFVVVFFFFCEAFH